MEKIFITGTGRCGTTFLIKLFTFLNFNTGFNKSNYKRFIFSHCNAGMEKAYTDKYQVLKNPNFLVNIDKIVRDKNIKIKMFIIPIRELEAATNSRLKYGKKEGGLWNATNYETQLAFYQKIMTNYLIFMTKHNIPTLFLDFEQMIQDKDYLFSKLEPLLTEKKILFSTFSQVYDDVSLSSLSPSINLNLKPNTNTIPNTKPDLKLDTKPDTKLDIKPDTKLDIKI